MVWLDSNDHDQKYADHSGLLAVGAESILTTTHEHAFDSLKTFYDKRKDWILGYLSYDLKNEVEVIKSENFVGLQFPELYCIQPKKLVSIKGNR